ncbi:MAG: hypothetical protein A2945_02465 [Candidatus Liptonbacteria bacterium RIFCSPLOWO2_01_FULL_52_25]|uniref:LiaI-LiaF-like transmembrane region domain-containing protein n=1 Tax=Candidatus Liptonbacteria bacterium RIFCSPLOWO2_01_FULL_52_25 TaxID=1798650 RepID=A0A1G2CEN2_9BACT|nr:MAG: hypothetical protein A2945_02465 [Candidatus Liptonbacteria bacterium RIFCSPLOWO2_01_FULL_52_25]
MDGNMQSGNVCKCPHHKVPPILIIAAGAVALAGNMGWLAMATANWLWPGLIIALGAMKLTEGKCKCC